jgi:hypothetical protein
MAFDLYLNSERSYIDHHEEEIFLLISDDEEFPNLNWLWQNFYEGPRISPEISNKLVHELLMLKAQFKELKDNDHLNVPIERILPFLSKAYLSNTEIRCASD